MQIFLLHDNLKVRQLVQETWQIPARHIKMKHRGNTFANAIKRQC